MEYEIIESQWGGCAALDDSREIRWKIRIEKLLNTTTLSFSQRVGGEFCLYGAGELCDLNLQLFRCSYSSFYSTRKTGQQTDRSGGGIPGKFIGQLHVTIHQRLDEAIWICGRWGVLLRNNEALKLQQDNQLIPIIIPKMFKLISRESMLTICKRCRTHVLYVERMGT